MKKKFLYLVVLLAILTVTAGCGARAATADDVIATIGTTVPTTAPASPMPTPAAPATAVPATTVPATPVPTVAPAIPVTLTVSAPALASAVMTTTYPALTMADVGPWIAKMGANGHPGHDTAGNLQCAYWMDPKFLIFADDTGPNTSGVEYSEGLFRFNLAAIADYKKLPADAVFVAEAAYAMYRGEEYAQSFLITTGRDIIGLGDAAIYALPNPASVEPFLALRQAHLICRGYEDSIVDFRSGAPVVTYTARDIISAPSTTVAPTAAPASTPVPGKTPAPTAVPATTGINATYEFGALKGTADKAQCVELKGQSATLVIDIKAGGFATSGRVSEATDWLLARSAAAGKYTTSWTGWLLCFDANADQAAASLVATDGNAKGNSRVDWKPN